MPNNICQYGLEFNNGWRADIPEGETIKVGFRMADDTVEYGEYPVTQHILANVGHTIEGSYYCVSLSQLQKWLRAQNSPLMQRCKSYFLPNTK